MTIIKEFKNEFKKITILQGKKYEIDTDILVCVIDDFSNDQKQQDDFIGNVENSESST